MPCALCVQLRLKRRDASRRGAQLATHSLICSANARCGTPPRPVHSSSSIIPHPIVSSCVGSQRVASFRIHTPHLSATPFQSYRVRRFTSTSFYPAPAPTLAPAPAPALLHLMHCALQELGDRPTLRKAERLLSEDPRWLALEEEVIAILASHPLHCPHPNTHSLSPCLHTNLSFWMCRVAYHIVAPHSARQRPISCS